MRRLSLKTRLSLWFTLILTLICALMLLLAAAVYQNFDRRLLREALTDAVQEEAARIGDDRSYADHMGELREAEFLRGEVRLMVYDEDGAQVAGLYLGEGTDALPFSDEDAVRELTLDGQRYYCCDAQVRIRRGPDYWVRGVVPAGRSLWSALRGHFAPLALLPLLIALAFLGGRWLTGRFLRPIRDIDRTTEAIRESGDLSRRIPCADTGDELSDLARHINAMFERLEQNFHAERQFTANASHELRTPVSVILAQCEYGLENAQDAQELREVIAAVQKQGGRMSRLIETLLLFTRMEQSTERYRKAPTDLSALLRASCADHALIAPRGITIRQELSDGVTALVNPELFRLLLDNLLGNALRYGREQGTVVVSLQQTAQTVTLCVSDDGPGISPEDLPHIWETFYRADKSRSSRGLGLGLPLVRQIAAYHGGTVSVESTPGVGSTFRVSVPA
ncbi:MAG: HAMP domain-containing histidine kinase [Oscillospiraceae bacterium]|nr:HAMP domain-containing histidine kinase [Oscillospiraceae bacterium]